MGWFDSVKSPKLKNVKKTTSSAPAGVWKKCTSCGEVLQVTKLEECQNVCPYCDQHFRISSRDRLDILLDDGTFEEIGHDVTTSDPLNFVDKKDYSDRLVAAKEKTGFKDGSLCGRGSINGSSVIIGIMEFQFMGGSMGVVTGEKIAAMMDLAADEKLPLIVVSCSGGARMQEGILSLMQMAKTSASRSRMIEAGAPYISLLTDPTTGGCAASFAMLGDINIAEPKALIGFAGPRVIEQSIRQTLPEGFQTSEFLLEHGFLDRVIHRKNLKKEISFFIEMFSSKGE